MHSSISIVFGPAAWLTDEGCKNAPCSIDFTPWSRDRQPESQLGREQGVIA